MRIAACCGGKISVPRHLGGAAVLYLNAVIHIQSVRTRLGKLVLRTLHTLIATRDRPTRNGQSQRRSISWRRDESRSLRGMRPAAHVRSAPRFRP